MTVIGPAPGQVVKTINPSLVYVKPTWADQWQLEPELRLASASVRASGQGLDSCTLVRRYGKIKMQYEAWAGQKAPWQLKGNFWVKLALTGPQGIQPIWIGRIRGQGRDLHGSLANGPSGVQTYQCYGPLEILRKIAVSRSFWVVNGQERTIGWVPGINDRDERGLLVGNCSANKFNGTYLYGGSSVWNHYDHAEYILGSFVDESMTGGPKWTLAGQADVLKDFREVIPMGTTQTVADVLRRLIPNRLGVDYTIFATDEGFIVWVYTLSALEVGFASKTLPKNPNTVEIHTSQSSDNIQTEITETVDHAYGRLRILGARIVVCCSLYGYESGGPYAGSLVERWDGDLGAAYRAGTGEATDDPAEHDQARRAEKFRPVYQQFGARQNWDFHGGAALPLLDGAGQLVPFDVEFSQNLVHSTLDWLPLLEGFDYSQDPPLDQNLAGYVPDQLRPLAWIGHPEPGYSGENPPTVFPSVDSEDLAIDVAAAQTELGVVLSVPKHHLLALNHWDGAAATDHPPLYDYEKLVVTIAFRSDQRLALAVELPGAKTSDGTLDIVVDDAEFWYLAPNTTVDVHTDGSLLSSGPAGRVLRSDADRLGLVMAGAISRYMASRARAEIVINGLLPWGLLVGQILTIVDAGGDVQQLQCPITAVSWEIPEGSGDGEEPVPTTTIIAGFASDD